MGRKVEVLFHLEFMFKVALKCVGVSMRIG